MTRLADALHRASDAPAIASDDACPWPVVEQVATGDVSRPTPTPLPLPLNGATWFRTPIELAGNASPLSQAPGFDDAVAEKMVTDARARPAAVEQYRRLAAALHHSQKQFGTKIVMIGSALQAEGKSLSICNLALTLSQSYGRRVLLMDGDLRHPGLHHVFQLPATDGLGEALRLDVERPLPVFEVSPNLIVLPAGRPDPDPLAGLASERMASIISEAAAEFEWVLIDTPPVGLVPDAKLLASFADAIVLVIRAGGSPCVLVQQAIEALGPEKIMGVLLNAAEGASTRQQNGYYGYGYGTPRT